MQEKLEPLQVFLSALALSSFGGLAALLRGNQPLSARLVIAAIAYSGLAGLTIALLWYNYFSDQGNIYFLLGVSALAGVGGTTVIDFMMQMLFKLMSGGLNISVGSQNNTRTPEDPPRPPAGG